MKTLMSLVLCSALLVGCAPARPPAFSGDLITVMKSCAESNTFAHGFQVGSMISVTKSANGDAILRCLYGNDVTLVFHGDPVKMQEQSR